MINLVSKRVDNNIVMFFDIFLLWKMSNLQLPNLSTSDIKDEISFRDYYVLKMSYPKLLQLTNQKIKEYFIVILFY